FDVQERSLEEFLQLPPIVCSPGLGLSRVNEMLLDCRFECDRKTKWDLPQFLQIARIPGLGCRNPYVIGQMVSIPLVPDPLCGVPVWSRDAEPFLQHRTVARKC